MQPAACGIMSLSETRRLQQLYFNMYPLPPATSTSGAASGEQRYCVWVHAHCDKFQPRSDRLCRSGFREVRVLSDARQPRNCASWTLFRKISCFSNRDNRGNGFSAILMQRVVEPCDTAGMTIADCSIMMMMMAMVQKTLDNKLFA